MTNQLIALPTEKKELEAVFLKAENLEPLIEKIREQAASLPTDMSVKKNREAVASFAYKIARTKTTVEKSGAQLSAEYKEIPKKIDASRKFYRETFEAVHAEVRGPLNDWELAEKMRVDELEARLEMLTRAATPPDETSLAELEQRLGDLEKLVVDESWQEIEAEAHRARQSAITALTGRINRRAEIERQQAEIERLKAEAAAAEQARREEQIAQQAAEQAQRAAAEQIAQAQQAQQAAEQAKAQAEAKAKADAEQAEQRAQQAAEQARRDEIAKQQAVEQAEQAAKAARAADIEHRAAINRAAAAGLCEGANLTPEQSRRVVIAIVQGLVPGVTINY